MGIHQDETEHSRREERVEDLARERQSNPMAPQSESSRPRRSLCIPPRREEGFLGDSLPPFHRVEMVEGMARRRTALQEGRSLRGPNAIALAFGRTHARGSRDDPRSWPPQSSNEGARGPREPTPMRSASSRSDRRLHTRARPDTPRRPPPRPYLDHSLEGTDRAFPRRDPRASRTEDVRQYERTEELTATSGRSPSKGLVAPPLPDTQGGRTRHPRWKARRRGSSRDRGLRSKNATFTPSKYGTTETPQSWGMPLWGHRDGQQPDTQG